MFNAGIRPAMNAGISVSRVGGAAQTKIMKKLRAVFVSHSRSTVNWLRFRSSPRTLMTQLVRSLSTVSVLPS